MGRKNSALLFLSALSVAVILGSCVESQAATVSCPGTAATTDREFSLTTTLAATCLASGTGNVNGSGDAINALGYTTLDKSDDGVPGPLTITPPTSGLSGTFSISATGYKSFVLTLKSGEGRLDPDWAAFLLPAGVLSGSWSISGEQELSHANLYGIKDTGGGGNTGETGVTPIPPALFLFGSGILGLTVLSRRRRKT